MIIRSLRGGIILIETTDRDAALAKDIVGAYAGAIQEMLSEISRRQTAYKREILLKLVADVSTRLSETQTNYDNFRLRNRSASPGSVVEIVSSRIPQLESGIKTKQVSGPSETAIVIDELLATLR